MLQRDWFPDDVAMLLFMRFGASFLGVAQSFTIPQHKRIQSVQAP